MVKLTKNTVEILALFEKKYLHWNNCRWMAYVSLKSYRNADMLDFCDLSWGSAGGVWVLNSCSPVHWEPSDFISLHAHRCRRQLFLSRCQRQTSAASAFLPDTLSCLYKLISHHIYYFSHLKFFCLQSVLIRKIQLVPVLQYESATAVSFCFSLYYYSFYVSSLFSHVIFALSFSLFLSHLYSSCPLFMFWALLSLWLAVMICHMAVWCALVFTNRRGGQWDSVSWSQSVLLERSSPFLKPQKLLEVILALPDSHRCLQWEDLG